jgi:hypothetical protein
MLHFGSGLEKNHPNDLDLSSARGGYIMVEHRLMTEREQADLFMEAHRLRKEGRKEEATAVQRRVPLPAFLAKVLKEEMGADFLIQHGWNLAEAEAEYGPDWLTQ